MTDFDTRLKQGLEAEDETFLKALEAEDGLFRQMGDTFAGPLKYWTAFAFVFSFILFGLSIYALYQVWQAETVKAMLLWFALFSFGSLAVGLIKIWFWLRMSHLATLRELKRIELRLLRSNA